MASVPGCDEEEHLWSIAAARLIFGDSVHIQAPPNLSSNVLNLIDAGVDDLGGISPVTIDYVNPEKPWPLLENLSNQIIIKNKYLKARAAIYPEFIDKLGFVDVNIMPAIKQHVGNDRYLKVSPLKTDEEAVQTKRSSSNLPIKA